MLQSSILLVQQIILQLLFRRPCFLCRVGEFVAQMVPSRFAGTVVGVSRCTTHVVHCSFFVKMQQAVFGEGVQLRARRRMSVREMNVHSCGDGARASGAEADW